MDYEVRPYKPEDYLKVSRRQFDRITFGERGEPELISKQLLQGLAFTGICERGIICCGGVLPIWKGVAEAWCTGSSLIELFRFSFSKVVRKVLIQAIKEYKLDRIQTIVDAEFTTSQLWLKRMGFEDEGAMEKYIAGRTYMRYAWIRRM
jgi:hypothetical protein